MRRILPKGLAVSFFCRIFAASNGMKFMMNEEERLIKILRLSHSQVLEGKSYSQDEAEQFLDQRLYEFRDKMVGARVAEPC